MRPRLVSALDAATRSPITVVTAPAGFGKSVLFESWMNIRRTLFPIWRHSFATPVDGSGPEPVGGPGGEPRQRARPALTDLVHAALAAGGAARIAPVLILDDVDNLSDPDDMDQVERLLHETGSRLRVVVLGRVEPPVPLYGWRLSGRLSMIPAEQLLFTSEETAAFAAAHGLGASARRLHGLTEGWPAVLALTVSSMCAQPDTEQVLRTFGADRTLAAYLDREVMRPLPGDLQATLRETAFLEHMSAGLIDAVTGRQDGTRVIASMERLSPLVTYVGGVQRWHRCHSVLRRHLYDGWAVRSPERLSALHRAAASWHATNGLPTDALLHTLAAADWDGAAGLVDRHWPELLFDRGALLMPAALPPAPPRAAADPRTSFAFALQHRAAGDRAGMLTFLRSAATTDLPPAADPALRDGIRLLTARAHGDVHALASEAAPTTDHADDNGLRIFALSSLVSARLAQADVDGAEEALRQLLPLTRRGAPKVGHLVALRQRARVDLIRGRLTAAAHAAHTSIAAAREAGREFTHDANAARLVLVYVHLERGQLAEAQFHLDRVLAGGSSLDPRVVWDAPLAIAKLRQLRGDRAGALDAVHALRHDPDLGMLSPLADTAAGLLEADLHIADGQPGRAGLALAALTVPASLAPLAATVTAKLDLLRGRPAAVAASGPTDALAWSVPAAVEAALVYARARWLLDDRGGCFRAVERALSLAEPEGIRRPFLANLPSLRAILAAQLAGDTAYPDTVVELTTAPPGTHATARVASPTPLTESLTRRESAVLHQLGTPLSTAEIAMLLNVSTNTVKTHVRNVYRKLDVARRRDAVHRARELGLA